MALLALTARLAAGQSSALPTRGDLMLRAGRVRAAETQFYAAARHRPRDPRARLALGRYLAARGALRVGAVLLEEARYFGGDSAAVARELAPVYARLDDYAALIALPRSPLSAAERERAAWLRDHPPAVVGDDSVTVAFAPAPGAGPVIGTFRALVGGEAVTIAVDASIAGWVLDPAMGQAAATRLFGAATVVPGRTVGVADVRIGRLSLVNVPVRFGPAPAAAAVRRPPELAAVRVGLDVLGAFAPTFDAGAAVLTLRGDGRVRGARRGAARVPAVLSTDGVYVPAGDALVSLATARGRRVVPEARRWTFDRRRGEIVVER